MIHVLIIDDHPVAGLTVLIDSDTDLTVAATARSPAEVWLLPTGTTVDLAIVDLQRPDTDGITLGAEIKHRWPGAHGLPICEVHGADIEALGSERGYRTLTVPRRGGKLVTISLAPTTAHAIDLAVGEGRSRFAPLSGR